MANLNDSIQLFISRDLVREFDEHPEAYGDRIAILVNGMWTDVYEDEEGRLYTYKNNEELIHYVSLMKR